MSRSHVNLQGIGEGVFDEPQKLPCQVNMVLARQRRETRRLRDLTGQWQYGMPHQVEHRGVEFKVVRTLSPAAWKWVVKLDHAERSGSVRDRDTAMLRAKQVIDEAITKQEQTGE